MRAVRARKDTYLGRRRGFSRRQALAALALVMLAGGIWLAYANLGASDGAGNSPRPSLDPTSTPEPSGGAAVPAVTPGTAPLQPTPADAPPGPVIALTFDDGPWPGQTEQILAILQERQAVATFFMLGNRIEMAPDLARAVAASGSAIGIHSWSHRTFSTLPPDQLDWEITATRRYVQEITGVTPRFIRTPGGEITPTILDAISRAGLTSALWTIDPKDWQKGATAESITNSVLGMAYPGGIVVMHDGGSNRAATIAALPGIIDGLRAAGYRLVTLDEIPEVKGTW